MSEWLTGLAFGATVLVIVGLLAFGLFGRRRAARDGSEGDGGPVFLGDSSRRSDHSEDAAGADGGGDGGGGGGGD